MVSDENSPAKSDVASVNSGATPDSGATPGRISRHTGPIPEGMSRHAGQLSASKTRRVRTGPLSHELLLKYQAGGLSAADIGAIHNLSSSWVNYFANANCTPPVKLARSKRRPAELIPPSAAKIREDATAQVMAHLLRHGWAVYLNVTPDYTEPTFVIIKASTVRTVSVYEGRPHRVKADHHAIAQADAGIIYRPALPGGE